MLKDRQPNKLGSNYPNKEDSILKASVGYVEATTTHHIPNPIPVCIFHMTPLFYDIFLLYFGFHQQNSKEADQ